ncbi:MAG TPA: TIGR02996 domain-containing protein [Sandaracinaceae bacterium LLY-WYZ-13_1]|nr:TIGR02996 domain-containing protein [Sandaracinaceae bacterium LLY-WYZ-13_1]
MRHSHTRNAELEAAILDAPADPTPCLVYAEWLEEHGALPQAVGYRVLGGDADDSALARELGLIAVSAPVWLAPPSAPDDVESVQARQEAFGPLEARAAAVARGGWEIEGEPDPLGASVLRARASTPPEDFLRLYELAIEHVLRTERSPCSADRSLAESLAEVGPSTFAELPAGPTEYLTFERLMFSHSGPRGVSVAVVPREDGDPAELVAGLAANNRLGRDYLERMTAEERLHSYQVEVLAEERRTWQPSSHHDALSWAFGMCVWNEERPPVFRGEERPMLDVLTSLGPYERGAVLEGPDHVGAMVFERATLICLLYS